MKNFFSRDDGRPSRLSNSSVPKKKTSVQPTHGPHPSYENKEQMTELRLDAPAVGVEMERSEGLDSRPVLFSFFLRWEERKGEKRREEKEKKNLT